MISYPLSHFLLVGAIVSRQLTIIDQMMISVVVSLKNGRVKTPKDIRLPVSLQRALP